VARVQTETAAQLFVDTIEALSSRTPAIVAEAAGQLGSVTLGLRIGDRSRGTLRAHRSRHVATTRPARRAHVELYFDDRAMNLIFDLQHRPVDEVVPASLDVRGARADVLAVWRTFRLLAQRASGLRVVQDLWRAYREQRPDVWGTPPGPADAAETSPNGVSGWSALDYLEQRAPHVDGAAVDGPAAQAVGWPHESAVVGVRRHLGR
jgi:geranylgeranyl diphosphate synthase, type II